MLFGLPIPTTLLRAWRFMRLILAYFSKCVIFGDFE